MVDVESLIYSSRVRGIHPLTALWPLGCELYLHYTQGVYRSMTGQGSDLGLGCCFDTHPFGCSILFPTSATMQVVCMHDITRSGLHVQFAIMDYCEVLMTLGTGPENRLNICSGTHCGFAHA